jgi:hypothetical protein
MGIFGKPKDSNVFFVQLNDLSAQMLDCVVFLEQMLDDLDNPQTKDILKEKLRNIKELNNVIIDDLHNSFITPIDREDIFNISNSFRELSRYSYSTVEEMQSFNIQPDEHIRKMIKNIRKQTEELHIATKRLEKNPRVATGHLNKVKEYEDEVEKTYRKAIYNLYEGSTVEQLPVIFLKREVYRHISNMSDKAISAAKVMGMIVMKLS